MKRFFYISLTLFIPSFFLQADDQHSNNFRQQGVHVHGNVELNLIQEKNALIIEIIAPGSDVVGFEHSPKTKQQTNALNTAVEKIENPYLIVTPSESAKCKISSKQVNHSLKQRDDDKHDHDQEHKHANDKHKHANDKEHKHGEFYISYNFTCSNIAKLTKIKLNWFELFDNTKKITAKILSSQSQTQQILSKKNNTINLDLKR